MNPIRREALAAGAVLAVTAGAGLRPRTAVAQDVSTYPNRPVRMLLGFAPGGGADIFARAVAGRLNAIWGQPVIIENRPGASGMIAAEMVAKAAPDGYTLVVSVPNSHSLGPHLMKAPYDAVRDFTPITLGVSFPMICVVGNSVPVNSMQELAAYAKANRGKLTYASTGIGSIQQIGGEVFNRFTDAQVAHVPYKGSAPAIVDVIAGNVTMSFDTSTGSMSHIKAGKLKALAVLSSHRIASLPNVPTAAEVGFPGFELAAWYGFHGPPGMPKPLLDRIQQDIARAMQMPEVKERMLQAGAEISGNRPDEFKVYFERDYERMGAVVKATGLKAE